MYRKWKRKLQGFDKVRVIFYRYTEESLKYGTRTRRTGGEAVRVNISDETVIKHLTTKQFFSNTKAKEDLKKYLGMKLYDVSQNVTFAVSYELTYISNISDIYARLKNHCHEQADTCIVLHSVDVTKHNPFTDLVAYCCDTDVLLLLLYYLDEFCSSTIFRTTNRDIRLQTLHSHHGLELYTSILGFHALTGCDQTGKIARFYKKMC